MVPSDEVIVIESNGDVYPCDFYAADVNRCGNVLEDELASLYQSSAMQSFLRRSDDMHIVCQSCRFFGICRGGCKWVRSAYLVETHCAYREFLAVAYYGLQGIANNRSLGMGVQ